MTEDEKFLNEQIDSILSAEQAKIDEEDCPMGDKCAIHHRNDETEIDEAERYGRIISYIGEYVVITDDNPEAINPQNALKIAFGLMKPEDLPCVYETIVVHVGDGALATVSKGTTEEQQKAAIRFRETFNEWEKFKNSHELVSEGVRNGLIDLSHSVYEDGE